MATLKDKRIVVLGGTSGLGFAAAQAAGAEGAQLVIASGREARVERALTLLPKGTTGYTCDFTHEGQIKDLFGEIGAFDHLVYTAGDALLLGDFSTISIADAKRAYDVRVWGAMTAAKYGAPLIRPGGSIVLTTGIASQRPFKGWVVPASLLGAMEAMTRALAVELAPIRVNIVSPGVVRTEMWNGMPEADREALFAGLGAKLLTGKVGEASEIAETYLYLMKQSYGTGQMVTVDGGGVLT